MYLRIEKRLAGVKGVLSFKADYTTGEAVIEYDSEECSLGDIVKVVRGAGYDIEKDYLEIYADVGVRRLTLLRLLSTVGVGGTGFTNLVDTIMFLVWV